MLRMVSVSVMHCRVRKQITRAIIIITTTTKTTTKPGRTIGTHTTMLCCPSIPGFSRGCRRHIFMEYVRWRDCVCARGHWICHCTLSTPLHGPFEVISIFYSISIWNIRINVCAYIDFLLPFLPAYTYSIGIIMRLAWQILLIGHSFAFALNGTETLAMAM